MSHDDDNGDGDGLTGPVAIQIANRLGAMGANIKTLGKDVHEIKNTMVRKEDCLAHMALVEQNIIETRESVEGAEAEATEAGAAAGQASAQLSETSLKLNGMAKKLDEVTARHDLARLSRSPTGAGHPAVGGHPKMSSSEVKAVPRLVLPVTWWTKLGEHSKIITQIILAVSALGGMLLLIAHLINKVELAMKRMDEQQTTAIKRLSPGPGAHVVYVFGAPDAGSRAVPKKAAPKK
jgi:hypothetical protein